MIVNLPFGTVKRHLTTGTSMELPNVIRYQRKTRIILQYEQYLRSIPTTSDHTDAYTKYKMCHAFMYNQLDKCAACERKSVLGMDNYTYAGISLASILNIYFQHSR